LPACSRRIRDGDSFHVKQGDKEFIFRLYFVDCPETDDRFPERVDEQAKYFGVSHKRAIEIGNSATAFTREALAKPFTVWTKWLDARGSSKLHRFYAVVVTDRGSLSSLLVRNGLARIYGVPTALPDRMKATTYIERLRDYEAKAKDGRRGGWK